MTEPSVIEVNLSAVDGNMRLLRRIIGPECGICPIVKADAYGLGAVRISRRLEAAGATMLAVYAPAQAAELFAAAVSAPVLVLMPVRAVERTDGLYRPLICGRLHLSVHGGDHVEDLIRMSDRFGARLPVHLCVDTGMCREGCGVDEAPRILARIASEPRLMLAGIFTHFASADRDEAFTRTQLERLERIVSGSRRLIPPSCVVHAGNTFATFRHHRYHKSMVRVGLAWAGYGLELMRGKRAEPGTSLQPTVTWTSRLIQIKRVEAGDGVGYGQTWTARRESRIGVIPVGYADGYPIALSGAEHRLEPAQVAVIVDTPEGEVRGYAPVVGAVSMEQITVDLTDLMAEGAPTAMRLGVGTVVELVSPDPEAPNHLPRIAAQAGTLPHVMLCGLSPRIRRVYHDVGSLIHTIPAPAAVAG